MVVALSGKRESLVSGPASVPFWLNIRFPFSVLRKLLLSAANLTSLSNSSLLPTGLIESGLGNISCII